MNQKVRMDTAWQDRRGYWHDDYNVCDEHAWRHHLWECPAPSCNSATRAYPYKVTYVFGGFPAPLDSVASDETTLDEVDVWEEVHIHKAESHQDNGVERWRWVILKPDGVIESQSSATFKPKDE